MGTPISSARVIAAFLIAPLAPSLIVSALVAGNILWFFVVAPFSYLFAAAGVPFFFLFRRMGWLRLWQVVAISAVIGGAISIADGFGHLSASNTIQFFGYGALTGLVFWLVAFAGPRSISSFKPKPLRGSA